MKTCEAVIAMENGMRTCGERAAKWLVVQDISVFYCDKHAPEDALPYEQVTQTPTGEVVQPICRSIVGLNPARVCGAIAVFEDERGITYCVEHAVEVSKTNRCIWQFGAGPNSLRPITTVRRTCGVDGCSRSAYWFRRLDGLPMCGFCKTKYGYPDDQLKAIAYLDQAVYNTPVARAPEPEVPISPANAAAALKGLMKDVTQDEAKKFAEAVAEMRTMEAQTDALKEQKGGRRDAVQFRYDLLNWDFLAGMAVVAAYASTKYDDTPTQPWGELNYQQHELAGEKSPLNHIGHHYHQYITGQPYDKFDKDRGWHLIAIAYNAMMAFYYLDKKQRERE